MPVSYLCAVELIRRFQPDQYSSALDAWQWLPLEGKRPLFASPFGDLFLQSADGFWFLDTLEGALSRPWATADALQAELSTEAGQDHYLTAGLAQGLDRRGLVLQPHEIYMYKIPPVLGGAIDAENVETIDFLVGVHINGQLHQQVRDLPPGTEISGFKYEPGG